MKFNIKDYIKPQKDIVIELKDSVDYLIDDEAVLSIENNEKTVILKRLYDSKVLIFPTSEVIKCFSEKDRIDYIDNK